MAKKKKPPTKVVRQARTRRHIYLVTKMEGGGILSRAELRELEEYEQEKEYGEPELQKVIQIFEDLQASQETARKVMERSSHV